MERHKGMRLVLGLLSLAVCLSVSQAQNSPITRDEFVTAVTYCGCKPPPEDVYDAFNNATLDFSREEAALFLAQLIHESMSFKFIEEIACKKNKCAGRYNDSVGLPGKYYYGRGYIQLTWGKNYKDASQALGLGNKLLEDPDLVASDKNIAMQVSAWYWKKHVRPRLKNNPNKFGITTKAINAPECKNYPERAKKRWEIYTKVVEAMNLENKAEESGCYD